MFGMRYVVAFSVLLFGSVALMCPVDEDIVVDGGGATFFPLPIAHWTFDEGSGWIATDVSGNGLNGTLSGPTWVPGIEGTGLLFDDYNDLVTVPDDPILDLTTSLTMELWFNATQFDSDGKSGGNMMFRKWLSSPVGQYAVAAYGGGGVRYWLGGDGEFQALDIQSVLTLNEWHYMVCTWDGYTMELYIDGDLITTQATSFHSLNPSEFSGDDLCMGNLGTNYAFKGVLDEVAIYDRTLSASEISEKYNSLWPVGLKHVNDTWFIDEDTEFTMDFENIGSCVDPIWSFGSDSDWLHFDEVNHTVWGRPDNGDIGWTIATVAISDGGYYTDRCDLSINVKNVVPVIQNSDITTIDEDVYYLTDYGCSEDSEPGIKWTYISSAPWLRFNRTSAVLNGTPANDDLGVYDVSIKCDDGNGGTDKHSFKVTVKNTNDVPSIITDDILSIDQNFEYKNIYEAIDPDIGDELTWSLSTNASWLTMNDNVLEGTPKWDDIGQFLVNVSVHDGYTGSDHHDFMLTVNNLNDPPRFLGVPDNATVDEGSVYSDIVEAVDLDPGDQLFFSIHSNPISDISIDPSTGLITWLATTDVFKNEPYILFVYVTVNDATVDVGCKFRITVNETPILPPEVDLVRPQDASKVKMVGSSIEWTGTSGTGKDLSYTVYLHKTMTFVANRNAEAVYLHDYTYTKIDLTNLEAGKKYYWTVIPTEDGVVGTCINGIRSFYVNNIPTYTTPQVPKAAEGKEFTLKVQGDDEDQDDMQHLKYALLKKPDGMTLGNQTGLIRWTPNEDQVGNNEVEVSISDGMESTTCYFIVEVVKKVTAEPKDDHALLLLLIGIIIVVLFLAGMAIVIVVLTRRKKESEQDMQGGIIGSHGDKEPPVRNGSAVPTTMAEAYGRPSDPLSAQGVHTGELSLMFENRDKVDLDKMIKKSVWEEDNDKG